MNTAKTEIQKELTIKDAFKELLIWKRLIQQHFIVVALVGFLGAAGGYAIAHFSTPMYKADLKFVMRSDANANSPLSGITSLLSGGTNPNGSPLERIIELIGSDRIVGNALLKPIVVGGKSDLLINHYIELEHMREKWAKDSLLSKVKFTENDKFDELKFDQRKAIKRISVKIIGKDGNTGIVSKSYDKKSGVVTLSSLYKDEGFAIELVNAIYREIIGFYIDQSVSTTRHNVEILTQKVDSIRQALDNTRMQFAENTDQSYGLLLQQNKVQNKSLAVKETMLTAMYAEAQKNLETLRYIEASTVPSFAVIDAPYAPIEPSKKSKVQLIIIGFMIFELCIILFYRIKEWYKTQQQAKDANALKKSE